MLAYRLRLTAGMLIASAGSACVAPGEFECVSNAECGSDDGPGICEARDPSRPASDDNSGFCSFADSSCDSGRRYGELAGDRGEQCVSCGGLGEPCCGKTKCDEGLGCVGSVCGCVTDVAAGEHHYCARKGDGTVWCWGGGNAGQVGLPVPEGPHAGVAATVPNRIGTLSNVDRVAARESHNCAISGGAVWCWGNNGMGQLGDGTTLEAYLPVQVVGLTNATDVALTSSGSCALLDDGTVACWGLICPNVWSTPRTVPAPLAGLPGPVKKLGASAKKQCALLADGSVWCWTGPQDCSTTTQGPEELPPAPVALSLPAVDIIGATANGDYHCARLEGGEIWCWGSDIAVFGPHTGTVQLPRLDLEPVPGPSSFDDVIGFDLAPRHVCAVYSDRVLRCWGENYEGALGDGTLLPHTPPTPVIWTSKVDRVATAMETSCALSLGRVWCWGGNRYAELGDGTRDQRLTPVETQFDCR